MEEFYDCELLLDDKFGDFSAKLKEDDIAKLENFLSSLKKIENFGEGRPIFDQDITFYDVTGMQGG
jgi:hypothetical protein